MRKIILSLFAMLISCTAMVQAQQKPNPVLNFQAAGLSFPVENEESTIEVNGQTITFGALMNGEGDPEIFNNISSFKIRNDNYMVGVDLIPYSQENFEKMADHFVPYMMEHMNDSVPNSRTFTYNLTPDYDTLASLGSSYLLYGGFFKDPGTVDETVYMSYNFIYVRAFGYMAVVEIFGEPKFAEYLNNYASRCVNLDKEFTNTDFLPYDQLAKNDDGVNFIQQLVLKMQAHTTDAKFKSNTDSSVGAAYYSFKQLLGYNAPSYKGQDKKLSKEDKEYAQKSAEAAKMEYQLNKQKKDLEKMQEDMSSKAKDVKKVKKLK